MNIEHLVRMANDISAFFDAEAGADAPAQIASHITRFWDPRMRREIASYVKTDGSGLTDVAREAVLRMPPPVSTTV